MISNLVCQLREQDAVDRLQEVLAEVPRVRADLGYPPLVTPSSQIVGTQAVLNVLTGERYKVVPKEVKAYVKGLYGRPPAPIDPEIQRLILGDEQPITVAPGRPPGAGAGQGQSRAGRPGPRRGGRALLRALPAGGARVLRAPAARRRPWTRAWWPPSPPRSWPSSRPRAAEPPCDRPGRLGLEAGRPRVSLQVGLGRSAMKLTVDGKSYEVEPGDDDSIV